MPGMLLSTLKIHVAEHLRLGADLAAIAATDLARIDRAIKLGLHRVYNPEIREGFIWDFLKIGDSFPTVIGTTVYTPFNTDFAGVRGKPTFYGTGGKSWGIEVCDEQRFADIMQSLGTTQTGQPSAVIIQPVAPFVPATGQKWQLTLAPKPSEVLTINFTMVIDPGVPANNTDYVLMGPECQNAVIFACQAEADTIYGRSMGMDQKYLTALSAAMSRHNSINNSSAQNRGSMGRHNRTRGYPDGDTYIKVPTINYL